MCETVTFTNASERRSSENMLRAFSFKWFKKIMKRRMPQCSDSVVRSCQEKKYIFVRFRNVRIDVNPLTANGIWNLSLCFVPRFCVALSVPIIISSYSPYISCSALLFVSALPLLWFSAWIVIIFIHIFNKLSRLFHVHRSHSIFLGKQKYKITCRSFRFLFSREKPICKVIINFPLACTIFVSCFSEICITNWFRRTHS